MKWTRLALPLAALALIVWSAPAASAQATKKASGTISAVSGSSISLKDADGKDWTFTIDKTTQVQTPGGGHKMAAAEAKGEQGVKVDEVLKVGEAAEVSYHDMGGTLHAASIRTMAKAPTMTSAEKAAAATKTVHGTVKDVSATSLTITAAGKDMTFAVDGKTRVEGKGMGTATKDTGGKAMITDLIKSGDEVSVTYHVEGMHAAAVRVTSSAPKK